MLASLLPGLREVRAPLASGVLVVFALALFFGDSFRSATETRSQSNTLHDLVEWIGRPGLVASALLLAYLIGSLVLGAVRGVLRRINGYSIAELGYRTITVKFEDGDRTYDAPASNRNLYLPYSFGAINALGIEIVRFEPPYGGSAEEDPGAANRHRVLDTIMYSTILRQVLTAGGRRLRNANTDMYGEFDRLQSEAELRDSLLLSVPLALLALSLNTSLSWLAEASLAVAATALLAALHVQARLLDRQAYDVLVLATADHVISVPFLDQRGWQR